MTREEEIKKQAEKKAHEPSSLMHPYAKQYKIMSAYEIDFIYEIGFIEGAEWADEHPHWISVNDELPKEHFKDSSSKWVLVCTPLGSVYIDSYNHKNKEWVNNRKSVTHWMPMPAPPHHIIDANKKKVDRVIGTADHIKTALDVLNKKGGKE